MKKPYWKHDWIVSSLLVVLVAYGWDRFPDWVMVMLVIASIINLAVAFGWRPVVFVMNCDTPPRFYGAAWLAINKPGAYCAPVPFNIMLGLLFDGYCWMRWGWRRVSISPSAAYAQGVNDGMEKMRVVRSPDLDKKSE